MKHSKLWVSKGKVVASTFSKTPLWINSRHTLREKDNKITDVTIIFYENHFRKAPMIQDFNFFK